MKSYRWHLPIGPTDQLCRLAIRPTDQLVGQLFDQLFWVGHAHGWSNTFCRSQPCSTSEFCHRLPVSNPQHCSITNERRGKCRQILPLDSILSSSPFSSWRPPSPLCPVLLSSRVRCRVVFSKQFALVIFSDSAAVRSGKIGNLGEVEREVFLSELDLIQYLSSAFYKNWNLWRASNMSLAVSRILFVVVIFASFDPRT